ncbi:response regulator [Spirochaeta dissipatitropha]
MASILLVEDNRSLHNLLKELLENKGHDVTVAENGSDGFACSQEQDFDLIITDIVIPYKSGIELIQSIRKREKKRHKILAISGGNQPYVMAHLETAKISGADMLLPKPFTNQQFVTAVHILLQADSGTGTKEGQRNT